MIDPQTVVVLQKQIRQTGRSFLQYVHESSPWISSKKDEQIVDQITKMVVEEQNASQELASLLQNSHSNPPYLGAYPMYFTTMNFLAIPRLLTLLVEHQGKDIEILRNDLSRVPEGCGREKLRKLLVCKEEHLSALKTLQETLTGKAGV